MNSVTKLKVVSRKSGNARDHRDLQSNLSIS